MANNNRIRTFNADTFAAKMFDTVFNEGGGGSNYTLSCGTGTFVLIGNDASARYGMPAGTGQFVLTGGDASARYGMPAGTGQFVLTGGDATRSYSLLGTTGAFALVGQEAQRGASAVAHGSSSCVASATVRIDCVASAAGSSTGACRARLRGLRAGGAGHDVDRAGLAPKRAPEEPRVDSYTIEYRFMDEHGITGFSVPRDAVLVSAELLGSEGPDGITVEAAVRRVRGPTGVSARVRVLAA